MKDAVSFQAENECPAKLVNLLASLGFSPWRYFPTVGSTNDAAKDWAQAGAPDWAMVIADEQTSGRGRKDRKWVTRSGSALAFSLVLRPTRKEAAHIPRFTALAALGLIKALESLGLEAGIKWPNDILLDGKKAAGVLVEADWQDGSLQSLVLGMGVNVKREAVPDEKDLRYPAISLSQVCGEVVDRWMLLGDILKGMKVMRKEITGDHFIDLWNQHLAFRGQWVEMRFLKKDIARVKIMSISNHGQLIVETEDSDIISVTTGEIGMVL